MIKFYFEVATMLHCKKLNNHGTCQDSTAADTDRTKGESSGVHIRIEPCRTAQGLGPYIYLGVDCLVSRSSPWSVGNTPILPGLHTIS